MCSAVTISWNAAVSPFQTRAAKIYQDAACIFSESVPSCLFYVYANYKKKSIRYMQK